MFIESQNYQVELEKLRKDNQIKDRLVQLNEDKLAAANGQIKRLLEEIGQTNDKLRKAKEEALKLTGQKRVAESVLMEQEQENQILKGKERHLFEETMREAEGLRSEIRALKARRAELEQELSRRDSELHATKIELEKLRGENMDLRMGNRALESQVSMAKEATSPPPMRPVMMRSEPPPPQPDPRTLGKKTCINELVQMVRNFKAEASASRK